MLVAVGIVKKTMLNSTDQKIIVFTLEILPVCAWLLSKRATLAKLPSFSFLVIIKASLLKAC